MFRSVAILFSFAFFTGFILIPFFGNLAGKWGLVTQPFPGKKDRRVIPCSGGLAMFSVFCLSAAMNYVFPLFDLVGNRVIFFLLAALVIVVFGLLDDIRDLSPRKKLGGQFLGALIAAVLCVRTEIFYLPLLVNIFLSMFWIMVLANAFNLLDILDGLAGTISAINLCALLVLGVLTRNQFVVFSAAALLAVLLAFLRYNLPPAKIIMGDAGSQFLGFAQAILAISLSYASFGREIGLFIPVVLMAVPLFDLFFVICVRISQGKSIFLKSNDHFVFRLLETGVSSTAVLRIMSLFALVTNICALVIFKISNTLGTIMFVLLMCVLFMAGNKLSRLEIKE